MTKTTYKCPICEGLMHSEPDATGIMIKCWNEGCPTHENVFGHSTKNEAGAYETACLKFQKSKK